MARCFGALIVITFIQGNFGSTEADNKGLLGDTVGELWNKINQLEGKLDDNNAKINRLETLLAERERRTGEIENELSISKHEIVNLEYRIRAQDHSLNVMKEKQKANDKKYLSELELLRKEVRGCVNTLRSAHRQNGREAIIKPSNTKAKANQETDDDHISKRSQPFSADGTSTFNITKAGNRVQRMENELEIGFFSTLKQTVSHIGFHQTIHFDHVITNVGNAYNQHIGTFTAPVPGIYVFSVTLATEARHVSHYSIYRNSETYATLLVNGAENNYDSSSQTVVLDLAAGDAVTVRHLENDHSLHGDNYCIFSGFLLAQHYTGSSGAIVGK